MVFYPVKGRFNGRHDVSLPTAVTSTGGLRFDLLLNYSWTIIFTLFSFSASLTRASLIDPAKSGKVLIQSCGNFPKSGVTSLLLSDGTIIAGTKTGKMFRSNGDIGITSWTELKGYDSKFPVYSLAAGNNGSKQVFCGGGDRYIAVWTDVDQFHLMERLGPHTGWVKDLVFDDRKSLLFSIGCNCIETWDCGNSPIKHRSKRTIENSPGMGSTLSSDLLSLCLVENGGLVSGGVDGRIHLWSPDIGTRKPLFSKACHEGRVNSLVYSSAMKTLFSVGNDGKLNVFRMSPDSFVLQSELEIQGQPRLSVASVVQETEEKCDLALGTTAGQVILIDVEAQDEGIQLTEADTIELQGNPMIYAICRNQPPTSPVVESKTILVGHGTGLTRVELPSNP